MRAEGADRMTSLYDPPIGTGPGSAPPDAPPSGWPMSGGPGGPGGPYGPYGYGGGGGPSRPVPRLRPKFLILLYVVVICPAPFLGLQASQGPPPPTHQPGLTHTPDR